MDETSLRKIQEEQAQEASSLPDSLFFQAQTTQDRDPCSKILGNGVDKKAPVFSICTPWNASDIIHAPSAGSLSCQWHSKLESNFCQATNLLVDPSKIRVSKGGEDVKQVLGRPEADELPKYRAGALQLSQCNLLHSDSTHINTAALPYHLFDMVKSVREGIPHSHCTVYEERTTLIVTRYEYANLYHTYTDWYSAYQAAMIALQGNSTAMEQLHIVFFDGHAHAQVDMGWQLLFPNATVTYISHYNEHACFRRVILVPPGYIAPTSLTVTEEHGECEKNKWTRRFRQMFVTNSIRQYRIQQQQQQHNPQQDSNIVKRPSSQTKSIRQIKNQNSNKGTTALQIMLLSRANYQAHPRMNGKVTRVIRNEPEVLHFLQHYKGPDPPIGGLSKDNYPTNTHVKRVVLEDHTVAEQILLFQQADIIIGMHGAGLSHILVARPGTMLLEIRPPGFQELPHFRYLAHLAGCLHQPHDLQTEDEAEDPYPISIPAFEQAFADSVAQFLEFNSKQLNNNLP
ncbi:Inherit from strNOG: K03714 glycoprotein 2-beta-D-xylosyltransferase [Seminavis robusta]|uniref:Inherit from strNOG: K03714 glycoprotein 2-beta-D-xylosyltransferase n=1 Tax=Seminavis robusta TaxID=568900 RepID=A0A9N8EDJ3_9STRA|nr:Inherit from strNOG: K03714 glycoprotein 2-beta-D-xylosyltransferase [Seminavis robusta]|eukprot:Sro786_g202270.1 Inherit from strNOG: K03714 glycoprotein 2-beta-D-xylosyltransferase EC 2.4.2.38 (513) ;mRNA; r:24680-26218